MGFAPDSPDGGPYDGGVGEREVIEASGALPLTRRRLAVELVALGVVPGDVLIVHSSLSRLGWVVGGAQAVVEALFDAVGPQGTVTMPGHSAVWSEPANWQHPPVPEPWWQVIRDEMPAFDPLLTPTTAMGAIVEAFRHHPDVVRSNHPSVSHLAAGPHAAAIVATHPIGDHFGDRSPLARLYDIDAKVLLLGVGHGNNTSLHLAEVRSFRAGHPTIKQGAAVMIEGERRWVAYDELDTDTDDFDAVGESFAATGQVRVAIIGSATVQLMPMRALVDHATQWFAANRP